MGAGPISMQSKSHLGSGTEHMLPELALFASQTTVSTQKGGAREEERLYCHC
jgi:hypothetical protein